MALSGAQRQARYMARLKAGAPISFGPDTPDEEIARMLYERVEHEKLRGILMAYNRLVDEEAARAAKRKLPARKPRSR